MGPDPERRLAMAKSTFICLSGSKRAGSINTKLAAAVAAALEAKGQPVQLLSLADYPMPLVDQDLEADEGGPNAAKELGSLIASATGVFIANPEYNASLTPLLKNSLDWMSLLTSDDLGGRSVWKNKAWAIGAASPSGFGGVRAINHLRDVLVSLGGLVLSEQLLLPAAGSAFGLDGQLTAERPVAKLNALVDRLIAESSQFADL